MKTLTIIHNKAITYLLRVLTIISVIVIFLNLTLALIPGSLGWMFSNFTATYVFSTLLIVIMISRFRYSMFQLEYEIVTMRDVPLFKKLPFNAHYNGSSEFPRRMVLGYKFERKLLTKNLVVKTLSNSNEEKIKKLDVSFFTASQLDQISGILDRILVKNARRKSNSK